MAGRRVTIGTRGSALALTQTKFVQAALRRAHPDCTFELEVIKTTGDTETDAPLAEIAGFGVFTKELEAALLEERVDLAVHSLKDLPTHVTDGLRVGAVLSREDPHDVLISRRHTPLGELDKGAVVGTGSLRRQAQILAFRSDLTVKGIRGNVDTRLRKLHEEDYDAIVLAYAGLSRLGRADESSEILPYSIMLPAPAQGALAVECRDESDWHDLLAPLHDEPTAIAVRAERGFLDACGGGCSVPVAALGRVSGDQLDLEGAIIAPTGETTYRDRCTGAAGDPEGVGRAMATDLLAQGASAIIDDVTQAEPS